MTQPNSTGNRAEVLGHGIFYLVLKIVGQLGAYCLLAPVVAVYVLCSRKIHRTTRPYLKRRFPEHGWLGLRLDTFRLVHSFGKVLVDRAWLGLDRQAKLHGEITRLEELQDIIRKGKGIILLTAHVGNWQSAFAHICSLPKPVHSLMHYEAEAVAKHYFDLRNEPCPFNIINSDGFLGGMVEATAALMRGEIVTIMGDRFLGKGPYVTVDFLGAQVKMPAAAYALASSTGAPIAVLLAAKTGRGRYTVHTWDIFSPKSTERAKREQEYTAWAGRFAGALEEYVRKYPYQWYNFFDFWSQ